MSAAFYLTCLTSLILLLMAVYIITRKKKNILHYSLLMIIVEIFILSLSVMMQGLFGKTVSQYMFWENMTYFGAAFAPVSLIILGRAYAQPDKGLSKKSLLLFIIPVLTIIMIWTNSYHHLFFVNDPLTVGSIRTVQLGIGFTIYAVYSYACLLTGFTYLIYFAIKNSGIWSIQAIMILVAGVVPVGVELCYMFKVDGFDAYSVPIAFTVTALLYLLGMLKFSLLKITPIALQTVINRISDSFIVVDVDFNILDYNKTFIDNFHYFSALRKGENFYTILKDSGRSGVNADQIREITLETAKKNITVIQDIIIETDGSKEYYTVEFTPISQRGKVIGIILLFKNVTQHVKDMKKIQENQEILLEKERLASLGQLIGGIAHNLKTPIMSVAGGIDQLQWLVKEYITSIDDPEVNKDDHKEIAEEMQQWLGKMKIHLGYMSDIISTVKDQATKFNNPGQEWFTVGELLKRVKILMNHELMKNKCTYKQNILVNSGIRIEGDINSMVQILDNIIGNAIQAYGNKGGEIVLKATMEENRLLLTVCDFASGIDEKVKDRLFKEMVTTKGKHGTGLGLYMSYSTIKGKFRGNMWFDSSLGKGTKFYIQVPVHEDQAMEVGQYA